MNPMRLVILLAVVWISGTLLFAAERFAPVDTTRLTQAAESEIADAPSRIVTAAAAEQEADPEPPGDSAAASAAAPSEAAATREATQDEEPDQSADARASAADRGSSPQRFVPSEQVRADFDVSFPIDI